MRLLTLLLSLIALEAGAQDGVTRASSGWFGISVESTADRPAVISHVVPGGPADRIRLRVGDTLFAVDGRQMSSPNIRSALAGTEPGRQLSLLVGTARGRFTYMLRKQADALHPVGNDSLPLRYRGEFASVGVEVLTRDTPVVSRDSSGAMLIRVGGHVIRLRQSHAPR